ncbi:hypothetical protein B566_EDAN014494 [Ephemera danica]|nr:hypothetical protein B566_EDAN014494 [Ephemera danica]
MNMTRSSDGMLRFLTFILTLTIVRSLENGLVRTPPMGWLAWERFRCNTDCKNDPDNCISDRLFRTMADLVVSEGYAAAGYQYINVDDCWLEKERNINGELQPDFERFPRGMRDLSDYVHARGLKFGIYEDYGNYTCAGYPGILGSLQLDAETFASWEVDYVKLDGCYSHPRDMDRGYPEFGYYLNLTGRPMVYSCSWPVYQIYSGMTLIIGNFGLSYEQSKTQMAIWAILAAPLLMSVDLRTIRPEYKAILQNRGIIAVDQDPLGIQGRRIYKRSGIEIWSRPITPVYQGYFSYAVAFLNRRTDGTPSDVAVTMQELGLAFKGGYEDLYEEVNYGILSPETKIKVKVNPSGVVILRANVQLPRFPARKTVVPPPKTVYNAYQQLLQSTARPEF